MTRVVKIRLKGQAPFRCAFPSVEAMHAFFDPLGVEIIEYWLEVQTDETKRTVENQTDD